MKAIQKNERQAWETKDGGCVSAQAEVSVVGWASPSARGISDPQGLPRVRITTWRFQMTNVEPPILAKTTQRGISSHLNESALEYPHGKMVHHFNF